MQLTSNLKIVCIFGAQTKGSGKCERINQNRIFFSFPVFLFPIVFVRKIKESAAHFINREEETSSSQPPPPPALPPTLLLSHLPISPGLTSSFLFSLLPFFGRFLPPFCPHFSHPKRRKRKPPHISIRLFVLRK